MRVLVHVPAKASERLDRAVEAFACVVAFPTSLLRLGFEFLQNVSCGVLLVVEWALT